MDPIRLNRAPWENTAPADARNWRISADEQAARDRERIRILEAERDAYVTEGRQVDAQAIQMAIDATRRGDGVDPALRAAGEGGRRPAPRQDTTPNPFQDTNEPVRLVRAPWEAAPRQRGRFEIDFDAAPPADDRAGFWTRAKDLGVKVLSSVPRAGESALGLVGLVPGMGEYTDPAGKFLGDVGKAIDDAWLSAYQLGKEKELQERLSKYDNFVDQAKEAASFMAENPYQTLPLIAGSVGELATGGAYAKGLKYGAKGAGLALGTKTAAAAGEGLTIAGGVSSDIGQAGGSYGDRVLYSAGAGLVGFGTGRLGGALLGDADIDTAIARRMVGGEAADIAAGGSRNLLEPLRPLPVRVARGVVGEGLLEEAPQSFFEQGFTNLGTDRPFMENTGGDTVLGAVAGSAMGGAFALRRPDGTFTADEARAAMRVMANPQAPLEEAVAAADYMRRVESYTQGPEDAQKRFAAYVNDLLFRNDMVQGAPVDLLSKQGGLQQVQTRPDAGPFTPYTPGQATEATRGPRLQPVPGVPNLMRDTETGNYEVVYPEAPAPRAEQVFTQRPVEGVPGVAINERGVYTLQTPQPSGASAATAVPPGAATAGAGAFSSPATVTTARGRPKKPSTTKPATTAVEEVDEDLELDLEEDQARLINAVGRTNKSSVSSPALEATVQGAKSVKAPGRVTFDQRLLKGVRDALLRKSGKVSKEYGRREQKVVDAANAFAQSYDAYLAASTNLARNLRGAEEGGVRADTAGNRADTAIANAENITALAADVRAKLAALGVAADNNAKNVEAIVRLVKDTVQAKLAKPGKTKAETLARLKKMDTALSSAWSAAKRETFMRELTDRADISGQQVRTSEEQQDKGNLISDMEKAATEGYLRPKLGVGQTQRKEWKAPYKGLAGVMQYLSFNTTPMGKVLALAIRSALIDSTNAPNVVFSDTEASRYDPNTNTVYYKRSELSAEVALHEGFHAALQWFVHQNPNHPAVKQLLKSLDTVLAAKDLTGKAKEVQDVLKKLVGEKRNLDAALELVSYGTTLNEFRRALQAMPSKGVPNEFYTSANALWRAVKRVVQAFLGGGKNVASDVFASAMQLLEGTRTKAMPKQMTGQVLEAKVQSEANEPPTEELKTARDTQRLARMSAQDYRTFTRRIAPKIMTTRFLFDWLGWDSNVAKKIEKAASNLADVIRRDFPAAERVAIWFDSMFSAGDYFREQNKEFKVNKNVGYQQMERLAKFVENRPAKEVLALMNYLDGDKRALVGVQGREMLTRMADNVQQWFDAYIAELPADERAFFQKRKFSESLLYATRSEQVARGTLGATKLASVIGLTHRYEEDISSFVQAGWIPAAADGTVDLDQKFYQVFRPNLSTGKMEPDGFMSIAEYNRRNQKDPTGFRVDATREWWLAPREDGKKFKFSSSMTARQAVEENKADQLANAMRNTAAALATNYASKKLFENLAAYGYEDGKASATSIAFDDVDAIKEATGKAVAEDRILSASEEQARSPDMISLYRRSGTWVRLPDTAKYGALRNKIIPGPVWTAMLDMSDRQPLIQNRAYNNTMRWFKKSKTVFNPSTHLTNIASNITLAMMHDIPVISVGRAAKMFAMFETNPDKLSKAELDMMQAFMDSGAMLGDYSSAEVKQSLYDAWRANMDSKNESSLMSRLSAWSKYEKSKSQKLVQLAKKLGKKADEISTETYAAEDNVFRLAAFLTKVGDLQAEQRKATATPDMFRTAGNFARTAFLDYDIDSKAVRVLRQSFLPFVSWAYAITPVLARMALHQPWKIANVMVAYYLIEAALASMSGGDDDEERKRDPKLRERLIAGMGPHMYVRLPFGDSANPVYYKLGDYVPFASLTKGLPNGLMGQSWIPSFMSPSGPLVSGIIGMVAGVDPYTGKPIHQPTDSEWDKFQNAAKFAYDAAMPPAVSSRNLEKAGDVLSGKTTEIGKEPSSLVFARMLGLKMYDFDEDEAAAKQSKALKAIKRDFKAAMNRAKKDEYRNGYPDYEALDEELSALQERMDERIDEIYGEEE